ncbi:hypothetical protein BURPS1710b_0627 [Burkholderia pseudomallei 1710b]|uniref:Uncharacterized protein n=1 Tax=Burkholderia pseudomallei (strain 1710b) TaxID=320372 RepID=Q3JWL2_BURP1|nr:hypothetical protein BURPS1710b_0627 [Burkholderia pseudomallei 1710b]
MREAHLVRLFLVHLERVRMHVLAHRQMVLGRLQVLADRQHVDVVRAQVAHHLQDLVGRLAQADHQARFRRDVRMQRLEILQELQRMRIVRAGARLLVQARHRFEIVVHHVGRRRVQDRERTVEAATEVRRQDLDARRGRLLAHFADALDEVAGAAVAQIVAVDARDHHVLELERRDRAREVLRLVCVERIGPAVADVAERAAARALVAHDHERRGALAEAFADVRAARFLAHRMQVVLAQDRLDLVEARAAGGRLHADPFGLLQLLDRDDLDRNARGLRLRLLLGGRIVGGSGRFGGCGGSGKVSHSIVPVPAAAMRRPRLRRRGGRSGGARASARLRASRRSRRGSPCRSFRAPRSRTG